jgi:hypothetical protein
MESATAKTAAVPNQGWNLIRIALAVLLLTASALKGWQLATEPALGNGLLDSRWLLIATVEFELLFGLWLLGGLLPKATWTAALTCFSLFTCVSFYKALSGHATCGCFGRVQVNPWYTTTLDLTVVLSLLRWRPRGLLFSFHDFTFARSSGILAVWFCFGLPAAFAMGSYRPASLSDVGDILGNDKIVVLEPEKWIGKRFPLFEHIDIGDDLHEGKWLVVLYHHDCPKCHEAIPKYEEQARRAVGDPAVPRVALIEMPPFGTEDTLALSPNSPCRQGRLNEDKEWFVETPAVVLIESGRVVPPSDDPSASRLAMAGLK